MPPSVAPHGAARAKKAGPAPAKPGRPGVQTLAAWLLVVQGLLTAALSLRLEGSLAPAVAIFGGIQSLFGFMAALGRARMARLALGFLGAIVVALALILAIVPVLWPLVGKAVWVPTLFGMLSASGLFGLLASEQSSRPRLVAGLVAIVLGWAGYGLGAHRIAPSAGDAKVQEAIEKWGRPDRSFANAELGLMLALPDGWSVLRDGHGLPGSEAALV